VYKAPLILMISNLKKDFYAELLHYYAVL
jgi:hypothetical protein